MKKIAFSVLEVFYLAKQAQKAINIVPFIKDLMKEFGLDEALLVLDNKNTNKQAYRDIET
eukprot:snap_masked-scaffold_10-processed-gene-13.41-mRNA-1 protein AED:1.00 eAED:1.00 QI:0/-1/0/0/-1/1/1/0/59